MLNPAVYGSLFDPLSRIANGDIELGSLFVQLHAALIIRAVQDGDIRVVQCDRGDGRGVRNLVVLTESGMTKFSHISQKRAESLQNG